MDRKRAFSGAKSLENGCHVKARLKDARTSRLRPPPGRQLGSGVFVHITSAVASKSGREASTSHRELTSPVDDDPTFERSPFAHCEYCLLV